MADRILETPAFLPAGAERLFSVFHTPAGDVKGGLVFCHPLAEEKLWAHRVYVSFARRLAKLGWLVLRFDFRGEGDSDGSFADSSVESRVQDVLTVLREMRARLPAGSPIGLVGLRLGASIAARAAIAAGDVVTRLVLWDPVVKGGPYMQAVLMATLAFQLAVHRKVVEDRAALVERMRSGGTVNIEGYSLSLALFEQTCGIDMAETLESFHGKALAVQIGPAAAPLRADLVALAERATGRVDVARAEEQPFWKEIKVFYQHAPILESLTERWIEENA